MQFKLGDIAVDVVQKDIKNLHLSVHPPAGKVRISAPLRMDIDTIRVFAITKLAWIKSQQKKLREQQRETPREYLDRESHYVWGKRYLLKLVEKEAAPTVELKHNKMILQLRPGASHEKRQEVLDAWYREQLKEVIPSLIAKWENVVGAKAGKFFVQKMKTKWGSCSPGPKNIRINTDLAKKPLQCLEYIVAHELIHLVERHHNERFIALMDTHMPQWPQYREMLNSLPLAHQEWEY
ncbi:M48 family metallopeptidase [Massilia antarctica]|uniref:M48 family metallopeptidase n=1 Tax=Massilia antarctica TaxID=2765360 RepID=A0AA48WFR3_9BURK|nr:MULTISPECIES: SprT family zinc-dependent metalloprotease [Massilia]MDM5176265.1 SprT family zinc-dependent metalloprotease [Massilia sp. DJPM01]QPI51885.1 M48 family metallopeptidase [Massilia antarctica]